MLLLEHPTCGNPASSSNSIKSEAERGFLLSFGISLDMKEKKATTTFSINKLMVLYLFMIFLNERQRQTCTNGLQKLQQQEHSQHLWDLVDLTVFLFHTLLLATKLILQPRRAQREAVAIL